LKGNLQFLKKIFQGYVSRFSIKGDFALEIVIYMTRDCFVNLTPNLLNNHLTKWLHIFILGMQPFYCNNHYQKMVYLTKTLHVKKYFFATIKKP